MNSEKNTFDENINHFIHSAESLKRTLPLLLSTIEKSFSQAVFSRDDFLKKKCEYIKEEDHYWVTHDNAREHKFLLKNERTFGTAKEIIKKNFVVSLVSQFDSFIGSMVRAIYLVNPELLNQSEKMVTFSDLVKFNNIEEARDSIIEKEVEGVLRNSHLDHFKWLENKLKIPLRKGLDSWPKFIEITERRNLFVHNDGKISSQYIKICRENEYDFKNIPIVGTTLGAEVEYFEQSFFCLFEIAVKLNQVVRRKLRPNDLVDSDASLNHITFDLIDDEQYELAREILDFSSKDIKKHSNKEMEYGTILNRAQAYKWLGNNEKCLEIVNSVDWSATSNIYRMVSDVLLEKYDSALKFMRKIGSDEEYFAKSCYKDWPIFKEIRKTAEFKIAFKDIYGDEGGEIIEDSKNVT